MSSYRFGKERFEHYFCSVCGTAVAVASIDPDMFPGMVAWNVSAYGRCDCAFGV